MVLTLAEVEERGLIALGEGLYVDSETGEAVEVAAKESFRVHNERTAEWVLGKLQEMDADIVREQVLLEARTRELAKSIERRKKARQWFHDRFFGELRAWAEVELDRINASAKRPTSTLRTGFGNLKFCPTRERIQVVDEAAAITYLEKTLPQAVQVKKTVLLTPLVNLPAESLPEDIFQIIPPGRNFKIDTGVAVPKNEHDE